MRWSVLGLVTGLVAGLVLVIEGFWAFLVVLLFGAIGLAIGKIVDGELDVSRYVGGIGNRGNIRSWRRNRR
jgi:uncharacterized membrane protein